jgi:ABC-2 type transport system permease protein
MRKYLTSVRIGLHDRLAYRGNVLATTFMHFISLVAVVFLWDAIFDGDSTREIHGYTRNNMVAYFVLVLIARSFSSMPGLATNLAREVRQGDVNKYLVRPVDLQGYLLALRVASKIGLFMVTMIPYAGLVFYLRSYFPAPPSIEQSWIIAISLFNGFLIGFLFHFLVGLASFFFLEVSSLLFIVMVLEFFLNGHMFPLDLLPDQVWVVVNILPFVYECFYPAKLMLGHITGAEAWEIILRQALWIVVLFVATRLLLASGLRRYGAYGG